MKKAALHNLGCKVNSYETKAMEQMLINDGYEIVLAKDAKNMVIPDGAVIDITDGFLSCRSYTDKGGEKKVVSQMVVMGFKMVAGQKTEETGFGGGFTALADDVPF